MIVPYIPEGFDQFWAEATAEAHGVPLDFDRSGTNDFDLPGFRVETFTFQGMGKRLSGWIALPDGAELSPGFLWIPPYGRESLLPNEYGTREGFVSLSFNFFGHEPFHQEKYRIDRGYFTEGVDRPETWVFRSMAQNAMIALRLLQELPEVDSGKVGSMGMSQGAGISIWLGAWAKGLKAVCADMPFLGGFTNTLSRPVHRYPTKELVDYYSEDPVKRDAVFRTLSYFDTVNQATRCRVPVQVSMGLKDPAARPDSVQAIYDALPLAEAGRSGKKLIQYDWGHDWHPDMVSNNREWLLGHL